MDILSSTMQALGAVFASRRFVPATVQRDYQWQESHCTDLLEDIARVFDANDAPPPPPLGPEDLPTEEIEPYDDDIGEAELDAAPPAYFLGTIVLRPSDDGSAEVYDGFQRLTSLVLLFAVLRDLLPEGPPVRERLHHLVTREGQCRLSLRGAAPDLQELVGERGSTAELRTPRVSQQGLDARLRRAARVFRRALLDWPDDRLARFAAFAMERVYLATISIQDDRIARQTFITTNARGLPINPANVLKGQIVDMVEAHGGGPRMLEVWNAIEQRLGAQGFLAFLRALDFVYRAAPQGPEHLTDLGEHLRKHLTSAAPEQLAESFDLYGQAWDRLDAALRDPERDPFGGDLWRLGLVEWTEWRPYALRLIAVWLREGEDGRVERMIRQRFAELHRRCVMIALAGVGAAERAKMFALAMHRKRNPMEPSGPLTLSAAQRERLDRQLDPSAAISDEPLQRTLLRWLEAGLREPAAGIARGVVEHVLPLNPPLDSSWVITFPGGVYEAMVNRLGNLALVSPEVAERAGQGELPDKRAAYGSEPAPFLVSADVRAAQRWDTAAITERTRKLRGLLYDRLGLSPP